jgi:DNA-binding winged helix-turn-helix (wHTH) protein/TolB-like protein/predicted Zn-dependent protease
MFLDNNKAFMLGQWKVDPGLNKISCADKQVILVPKVMAILLALVESEGKPLKLKTLMASVWQQQVVSDSSVYQAIAQLRKALGDTAAEPTYIERVSGKGYRLIARVEALPILTNQTKIETDTLGTAAQKVSQLSSIELEKNWLINWCFWLVAIFVVIVISVLSIYQPWQVPEQSTSPLNIAQIDSISLQRLSTENLGQAEKLDALNDVLLTQLMQIKQMRVVSLNQAGLSPSTQAIIKGRIHKQDNSIRVFLQLIQVDSQEVIWAKIFNGKVDNLFALQDSVVETLLGLFKRQQTLPAFKSTQIDNRSFDQYLLARHLWQQCNGLALYRAKAVYEEMQQQQTLFPLAAVGLCDTYQYLHFYADWSLKQALDKCRPLLQQALAQQPELGQAIAAQGLLLSSQGKKNQAEKLFEKAIKLTPNYPFAHMWYAGLKRRMGKYKQSLSMNQTAYALAPMSPMINRSLAYAYLSAGNKAQARFYYRRTLDLQSDYSNRAIEELDFLPMTIDRARAFLLWAKEHPSIMRKQRSYQLTQAQIELALGKYSAVAGTLKKLQDKQVNRSFKLFIQTSLAAAQGRYQDVIAFIEQRMAIHQDDARYAGAYLSVLYQMRDDEKAYKEFLRLRPELADNILSRAAQGERISTAKNRYKLMYYVQLQARRGNMHLVSDLAQQLDNSFAHGDVPQDTRYARWLLFRQHKEAAKTMILSMMHNGWLPDYNSVYFADANMKQLFIDVGLGKESYQTLLNKNRAQVVAGLELD